MQDDKLQFQLEAFRFQEESSGAVCGFFFFVVQVHSLLLHVVSGLSLQIYITCFLKASAASVQVNEDHKACSFKANG